jgi:hypothetical protein
MTNRTVSAGRAPHIKIENAGGDLSIVGSEGEDLLIKSDDEASFSQDGDQVTLACSDDMALRVPRGASLQIQTVGGDLALRGVSGDIYIQTVGGDASIREANNVTIGSVKSDLSLRGARGNVAIGSTGSDASMREIQGDVTLESIGDDLVLREVRGSLKANVSNDVVISLAPRPGNTYAVEAGDDVMLVLPSEADAELNLEGDEVIVSWPGVPEEEEASSRTLTLGNGGAKISIRAGGQVRVSSQERAQQSPDEFGNFAGMMMDWSDFGAQLGARITRRVEEVTNRAARQAGRAARKAEAKLRGRPNLGRWDWNLGPGLGAPPAKREPVSEEERMAILKMLAEKKITAAQADELLKALEGGQ